MTDERSLYEGAGATEADLFRPRDGRERALFDDPGEPWEEPLSAEESARARLNRLHVRRHYRIDPLPHFLDE